MDNKSILFLDTKDCDDCIDPRGQIACFASGDIKTIVLKDKCTFKSHQLCYRCSLNHPEYRLQYINCKSSENVE